MSYSEKLIVELNSAFTQLELHLEEFIISLETERNLLDSNDIALLSKTLEDKKSILDNINASYDLTHQILKSCQYEGDKTKLGEFISQLPSQYQASLKPIWSRIQKLLFQSERLNLMNGVIITIMKNHNATLLHLLAQKPKETIYGQSPSQHIVLSTREHKV